jgi:ketosteroid isomerase-like protein
MTKRQLLLLGGLLAQAGTLQAQAVSAQSTLHREIRAVNDSMVAAFNSGNMLAVARFYADDARVDGEKGAIVQGRAAIDRYWTEIQNAKSWTLEIIAVGGPRDFPWQIGRSTLVQTSPQGDRTSIVEFLALWRREPGGGLRMVMDYYRY